MVSLAGFTVTNPKEGKDARVSSNLATLQENQVMGLSRPIGVADSGAREGHNPLYTWATTRQALIQEMLMELVYNRLHITPALLELGNVIGRQSREVKVWNAYFTDMTLTDLAFLNAEGITAEGPPGEVQLFKPLQEKIWTITVTEDGPPTVDATLTWNFDGGLSFPVGITGSRLVLFSFYPTWEGGILERLEWLTDVIASPLGVEQRRQLRLAPRRSFQLKLIAKDRDRQYMDLVCMDWGARHFAMPVWPDIQEMPYPRAAGSTYIPCRTEGLDFRVGGLVMFRGPDSMSAEVCEIAEIDAGGLTLVRPTVGSWPVFTKIYPVRAGRFMEQPTLTRLTDRMVSAAVTFQTVDNSDFPALPPTLEYKGFPVLTLPPEESESLTLSYLRLLQTIDNKMARPQYTDTASLGFTVQQYRYLAMRRAGQTAMRGLAYHLRGRFKSMWVPTFYDDMTLASDVLKDSSFLEIEDILYSKHGKQQPGRRHVLIQTVGSTPTYYARQITDSYAVDGGKERLVVDPPFDVAIPTSQVARISFMVKARMENDFVEINHQTDAEGVSATALTFRSLRDDYN